MLPLNRVHRDDFPDLKPNFIPKLHMKTLEKHLNIYKDISHRPHKTHYIQRLVIIKEISTKMYFCMPHELLVPFSTTYTKHTDFILAQI